jgi:hypothetical protein
VIEELVSCASSRWELHAGDQTIVGWIVTLAYLVLVLAIIKLIFDLAANQTHDRRHLVGFWIIILLIYLLFGLNKQLDLQTFLTSTGRCLSKLQGWYRERRAFQFYVVMAGLAATAIFLLGFLVYFRTVLSRSLLAILGVTCSLVYVVLRAASIHHVDQWFKIEFFTIKAHAIMEMAGIALVFINIFYLARNLRTR